MFNDVLTVYSTQCSRSFSVSALNFEFSRALVPSLEGTAAASNRRSTPSHAAIARLLESHSAHTGGRVLLCRSGGALAKLTSGSYSINTRLLRPHGSACVGRPRTQSSNQTNITIPVGSTAEVVHDAQLRRGAWELTAVLESGGGFVWNKQSERR